MFFFRGFLKKKDCGCADKKLLSHFSSDYENTVKNVFLQGQRINKLERDMEFVMDFVLDYIKNKKSEKG